MSTITTPLFLDAIGLLLYENNNETKELIDQLITAHYEALSKTNVQDDVLSQKFISLLEQLKKIPNTDAGKKDKNLLVIKFLSEPEINNDKLLHSTVREMYNNIDDPDASQVENMKRQLATNMLWSRYNKLVKSMWTKLSKFNATTDLDTQDICLTDVVNLSRSIIDISCKARQSMNGAVERVDFSNKESIRNSICLYKQREVDNVLVTGLQGINQMLGKRNGLAQGESLCIYALMHNFKSGLLMTLARGIVRFNNPPKTNSGIPIVLFISLENEANRNLMWLYRTAYETTTNSSSEGKSDDEVIEFIHTYYNQTGYKLFLERWVGSKFGFDEYTALVEEYENNGYQVCGAIIDYANKMKKVRKGKSDNSGRNDLLITELFENLCSYNKTKGITFITAHQLNRSTLESMRLGKVNMVKSFSAFFVGGSIGVSQEVDAEIFIHLETNNKNEKYLTMMRGKHRYVDDTPETHKYCAYPFTPFGIGDDYETEPGFIRDIYARNEEDDINIIDLNDFS